MAVKKPDSYRHNNETEPFVLPFDYQVGATVADLNELVSIPNKKINVGGLVYVVSENEFYKLIDNSSITDINTGWEKFSVTGSITPKRITVDTNTITDPEDSTEKRIADRINARSQFEIFNGEFPIFSIPFIEEGKIYFATFNGIPSTGLYGINNTQVSFFNIQVIGERILNLNNLSDPTTDRIDLGDIGSNEVWNFVASEPSRTIQGQEEGYTVFEATQRGIQKAWFYVGQTGGVGSGEYEPVESDFNLVPTTSEIIEQIVDSGGNYNNLELTGNVIQFTNTNAQAIVNGFSFNAYKRITLINNSDFDVRLNAEDTNSDENKRIKLPTGLTQIGIQGTTELVYVDSIERWQIVDAFASKYRPEHRGLDEFQVEVVGPQAVSETREIIDLIVFRDTQATDMTRTELDLAYPDADKGFRVVCNQIAKTYILDNINSSPKGWHYLTHGTVSEV
jgi:hypothetical protein